MMPYSVIKCLISGDRTPLIIPTVEASQLEDDEGSLKPAVAWGHADLALKPRGFREGES